MTCYARQRKEERKTFERDHDVFIPHTQSCLLVPFVETFATVFSRFPDSFACRRPPCHVFLMLQSERNKITPIDSRKNEFSAGDITLQLRGPKFVVI